MPHENRPRFWNLALSASLVTLLALAGCTDESNPLAPYEGHRPLDILKVTQSFNSEIQWVGGRVAAVGVNRGDTAALDSTLVWLRAASDNDISSVVRIDDDLDWDLVESFGGTPLAELEDEETYTFWLATTEAYGNGLDPASRNGFTFADTTMTMRLVIIGRSGGDPSMGVDFRVIRDERITDSRIIISWTPEDLTFRQMAIRQSTVGGWTNLLWHFRTPEDQEASISSPLILGVTPEDAQEIVAFDFESGFAPAAHILWANTDAWNEAFTPTAPGYAFYQMFASNFQD